MWLRTRTISERPMTELEKDFTKLMFSIYERAKEECDYNATYFLSMLGAKGGVGTAKYLLSP